MTKQAEISFKNKIVNGLAHRKSFLIVLSVVLIIIVVGIFLLNTLLGTRRNNSALLAEEILETYQQWKDDTNPPENRDRNELDDLVNQALNEYSNLFVAQRARFTLGLMAFEEKDWETAYFQFESLANKWDNSYLAPVSLFNAAAAREQAGDLEGSIANLQRIVSDYKDYSLEVPEALFNIARLQEQNDQDKAIETYKSISSDFPNNRWANIAKSRVLELDLNK